MTAQRTMTQRGVRLLVSVWSSGSDRDSSGPVGRCHAPTVSAGYGPALALDLL